jgi:signal peptidase II
MEKRLLQALAVAITVLAADRIAKWWALTQECQWKLGICTVGISPTFNRGISWGMFDSDSRVGFAIVSGLVGLIFVMVCVHAWYTYKAGGSLIAYALIIGGALSNIIDRVMHCAVIDFISLSLGNICGPVFNIADAAIVTGVLYLLYESMWGAHDAI